MTPAEVEKLTADFQSGKASTADLRAALSVLIDQWCTSRLDALKADIDAWLKDAGSTRSRNLDKAPRKA